MKPEDHAVDPVMITPDYWLMHMVQNLSDGADAHRTAEEMNHYFLAIQGMNESKSTEDRVMLEGIRQARQRH